MTFGVELIDFDSGYLVHDVLQFHLFLLNIVTNFMSLFEKIASCFLDSGMFTFLVNEIFIKFFSLCVQFHDIGLNLVHGLLD